MSLQLMVDIETLSTHPDAAIVSIGACTFMLDEDTVRDQFEIVVSAESNERANRHIQAGTVMWWFAQSEAAMKALLNNPAPLNAALTKFALWCTGRPTVITDVWANDPDFDVVILSRAFRAVDRTWPFQFWQNRSLRTIQALAYPDPNDLAELKNRLRIEKGATHHRAVDDAIVQARVAQICFQKLMNLSAAVETC